MSRQLRSIGFAVTSVLALATCAPGDIDGPNSGSATLAISADLSGTSVAVVVLEVTAVDIPTPLVFNLPVVSGVASGTITLPAGSGRTIHIRAFDAGGVETHRATTTLNVQAGTNPTISLVLSPLTGDTPIVATIGSVVVTVTPSTATVAVDETVTLEASVTVNGNPVTATVRWATLNPGVADVTTGVVVGIAPGETRIVATVQGAAGAATITVTGP
jgi:hypothetical protein